MSSLEPTVPDLENLSAEAVLQHAIDSNGSGLTLACSFQKEETVLIDMLIDLDKERVASIFSLDTGVLFPETYSLWKQIEQLYKIKITPFQGPTLAHQAAEYGDKLWEKDPEKCCYLRKVKPLQDALSAASAWVTGVRRDQSPTRAGSKKIEWDSKHGLWKYNPLADWTDKDVWAYIAKRKLPYNELHDKNYSSIGCTHCTKPGSGREGRWSGSDKTECGLHTD